MRASTTSAHPLSKYGITPHDDPPRPSATLLRQFQSQCTRSHAESIATSVDSIRSGDRAILRTHTAADSGPSFQLKNTDTHDYEEGVDDNRPDAAAAANPSSQSSSVSMSHGRSRLAPDLDESTRVLVRSRLQKCGGSDEQMEGSKHGAARGQRLVGSGKGDDIILLRWEEIWRGGFGFPRTRYPSHSSTLINVTFARHLVRAGRRTLPQHAHSAAISHPHHKPPSSPTPICHISRIVVCDCVYPYSPAQAPQSPPTPQLISYGIRQGGSRSSMRRTRRVGGYMENGENGRVIVGNVLTNDRPTASRSG
ncbi:hypothetical protein R3P38DRAFT_2892368 [Favolaschia claudopus]|uniref:Uncharacterized protein n=1 Tax=Favolaschia claudopus TaxID=2862362 RepID=A0AAW0CT27_9AGAR